jgi:hypothetical protein
VPEIPDGLLEAARGNELVLVLGAGCSAQASLPTSIPFWLAVLDHVSDVLDSQTSEILRVSIIAREKAAIETLRAKVDRDRLILRQQDEYWHARIQQGFPNSTDCLGDGNWAAVVGLTWDELDIISLAKNGFALVRADDSSRLPELLRSSRPVLIKPIGDLRRPETIAWTWQDYREVLERWPELVRALATLFSTHTLLFMGAGLDTIEQFLHGLPPRITPQRTHYALVPADRTNQVWQAGIGSRFDIKLLEMIPTAGYPELPAFMRKIVEAAPRKKSSAKQSGEIVRTPRPEGRPAQKYRPVRKDRIGLSVALECAARNERLRKIDCHHSYRSRTLRGRPTCRGRGPAAAPKRRKEWIHRHRTWQ